MITDRPSLCPRDTANTSSSWPYKRLAKWSSMSEVPNAHGPVTAAGKEHATVPRCNLQQSLACRDQNTGRIARDRSRSRPGGNDPHATRRMIPNRDGAIVAAGDQDRAPGERFMIVSGGGDGKVEVLDFRTAAPLGIAPMVHQGGVSAVALGALPPGVPQCATAMPTDSSMSTLDLHRNPCTRRLTARAGGAEHREYGRTR